MTTALRSANLVKDTTVFLKSFLTTNIADPITTTRSSDSAFVLTHYPVGKKIEYPLITVVKMNKKDRKLGMQSEVRLITITMEVRVWARNPVERDSISDEIYNDIRDAEMTANTGFAANSLHDLVLLSSVSVDEPEHSIPKSEVMEFQFMFITA